MEDVSLSLYHYMCKNIVGTENHVKTIRLMNTVGDHLSSDDVKVRITSGSFGEGLQMYGSDVDIMYVLTFIHVHNKIKYTVFGPINTCFVTTTEDTKAGFAMLRLLRSQDPAMLNSCEKLRRDFYLSSSLFRKLCLTDRCPVEHGPCVSDTGGYSDFAYCLHSKSWFQPASKWIIRPNNSWPDENTKKMIIKHGVLFVPIGSKGSEHEELEWRISFSVAEKFLIYTFSHAQFTCYALMKILLKDVIDTDSRCKDSLCSYYLKTIIFWISEELPPTVWTPDNLIPCFMRCFRRLIYCVQYSVCPHYFIPENDLFKFKIDGGVRDNLIDTLRVLLGYGWRCILFSNQISVLHLNIQNDHSSLYCEDINKLLNSKLFALSIDLKGTHNSFGRAIQNIIYCFSNKVKYIHAFFISNVCCKSLCLNSTIRNKNHHKHYNTCLSYLLMNINHDIVSGWLLLASFFYNANQYKRALIIISYALSKCTPDKIFLLTEMTFRQRRLVKWHFEHNQDVVRMLKFILADNVHLKMSSLIPMELLIEGGIFKTAPVVYAHFLGFLCHYHMNNRRECRNALKNLQLTISSEYLMVDERLTKLTSYYCLGTALQLMGDNISAKQNFKETLELLHPYPYMKKFFKRLSMIGSL